MDQNSNTNSAKLTQTNMLEGRMVFLKQEGNIPQPPCHKTQRIAVYESLLKSAISHPSIT